MANIFCRQWVILEFIPRYPRRISISDILEKLERIVPRVVVPHHRTIQRDLDILASVVLSLEYEIEGRTQYWFIGKEAGIIDLPRMSTPTALAFHLAEKHLHQQLPPAAIEELAPHFVTANKRLNERSTDYADWLNKVRVLPQTQSLIAPTIDSVILNTVYTALLDNKRFEGDYLGRKEGEYKHYLVNPVALVVRGTVIYLVCTLRDYLEIRILNLNRFVAAEINETSRWVPNGFSIDDYIEEGHFDFLIGDDIDLELIIDEEVAIHLREAKLTEEQILTSLDNGQSLLIAKVKDTGQLRWWLLGFAEQIEVVAPKALRDEFAIKTQAMARKYQT